MPRQNKMIWIRRQVSCSITAVSLGWLFWAETSLGVVSMDLVAASEAVAGLLALGAVKELGQEAGGGLMAGIVARVRKVFGSDTRSVAALEQARQDGTQAAVAELTSALAWYARRDREFAQELAGWAAQVDARGVTQRVDAGRDAYTAGRDQTILHYQRPSE
jgi:hypothetical protein